MMPLYTYLINISLTQLIVSFYILFQIPISYIIKIEAQYVVQTEEDTGYLSNYSSGTLRRRKLGLYLGKRCRD